MYCVRMICFTKEFYHFFIGLIVLPTAIINSTPLDCTFCTPDLCPDKNMTKTSDPEYNAWWVKKYCTYTAIDAFVLYFPYFLLFFPLVILLIERLFVRIFKSGLKLDALYNLLVSESLLEGSETITSNGNPSDEASQGTTTVTSKKFLDLENSKLALEVAQSFSQSSSYFYSYLIR